MGCLSLTAIMTHHHLPQPQTQSSIKALVPNYPLLLSSLPPSPNRRSFLSNLLVLVPTVLTNFQSSCPCLAADEFDPVSQADKDLSVSVSQRVALALALLDKGRELQAQGDFVGALDYFTQVIKDYKDFAFSDYARIGRAFALYETGDREEAIAEMEDVSISLKGYPEVHAALAAALYVDKKAPLLAENQFAIATLLDPHYTDISYVKDTKHWPPSLVSSLKLFISLS